MANDSVVNISDFNQQLDVCLKAYSVISIGIFCRWQISLNVINYIQVSIRESFFSGASWVDARYSTFTVARDQYNVYNNSAVWMVVVVLLFSLILQRTIVSSQVNYYLFPPQNKTWFNYIID